ncbi:uncharacterized protein TRUGW13939_00152 [Talaromyces rugulosus]|uniref:Uncharacterized protein n=1 Tax=Talaromyces rugulosus TaxID=121627 RepID=A0A7H8QHT4_TALRU|nr:uncharacterized protein TRUGW13939_00152 [Talaromyces rugulosus]QKX53081.1 hypothetical protein TRUGW13939_00152 [Talaromyces rugulosus]
MAVTSEGSLVGFIRRATVSSRNRALISIVSVVGGTVLLFRSLRTDKKLVTSQERSAMHGGNASPTAQTDQGTLRSSPRPNLEIRRKKD